jgi:hypothetical protein
MREHEGKLYLLRSEVAEDVEDARAGLLGCNAV